MINLNDPEVYKELDPANMLATIRELPQQCRDAWQNATRFRLPPDYSDIDKVVILGMGGSAIGGELIRSLTLAEGKLPVLVHHDYDLPPFVDAKTLVIASSYSGQTEETISAFTQALDTDAKKLVITTGGKLKAVAEERGVPVFTFNYQALPRAAFGHSFVSLIAIFQNLGLLPDKSTEVMEMIQVLDELLPRIDIGSPVDANPAKKLATSLFGRLVVIYGAGILAEVAHRWKTQINENSKTWAFHEVFPELNHNAVVGYEFPKELAERMFVVLLRSSSLHPRILIRYQVTAEILAQAGIDYHVVEAKGAGPLSQVMSTLFFGDYVSYYLALLYRADPSPVRVIDYLKRKLAEA